MFPAQLVRPADLPAEWRTQAEGLRHYGTDAQAVAVDRCANRLEEAFRQMEDEHLTLGAAAEISGYTERHLRRLMDDGTIPNSGTPNSPRLRRYDLPRKPGHGIAPPRPEVAFSIVQVARAIATRGDDDGST
jgi:hypothetical protein